MYLCMHVYVCCAPCCADSDMEGSRGLKKLIKCNDAMWGDLAVCVLIKSNLPSFIPHQQQEKKSEKQHEKRTCDTVSLYIFIVRKNF